MRRYLLFGGIGCGALLLLGFMLFLGVIIGASGTNEGQDRPDSSLEEQEAEEGEGAEPQPEPLEFSGTGPQATEPFELSAGLARFEMTHQGESNFIVELLDEEGNEVGMFSLVNEIGPYDGSQAVQIPEDGTYLLNVDADGAWTIRVE